MQTDTKLAITKPQILALLYAFVNQRPGLEYGNYGDPVAYRAEMRSITRDRNEALQMLRTIELADSITAPMMLEGFRAFSGRLVLEAHPKKSGAFRLDYCTGQYWPTEYRRAVCAVAASILWYWKRAHCMPAPVFHVGDGAKFDTMEAARAYVANPAFTAVLAIEERYAGMRPGDWLRKSFRINFGRGIASRWFA